MKDEAVWFLRKAEHALRAAEMLLAADDQETAPGPKGDRFRLTDKAGEQERYQAELRKALASNSPAEILKRMAESN